MAALLRVCLPRGDDRLPGGDDLCRLVALERFRPVGKLERSGGDSAIDAACLPHRHPADLSTQVCVR